MALCEKTADTIAIGGSSGFSRYLYPCTLVVGNILPPIHSGLSWVLNTLKAFNYSYLLAICDFIGCFIWPYMMTVFLPFDILTTVTIGLALNAVISYALSIVVLRYVLFLPKYNKREI